MYLEKWVEETELRSNWTIARKGHQQPDENGHIPAKFGKSIQIELGSMPVVKEEYPGP